MPPAIPGASPALERKPNALRATASVDLSQLNKTGINRWWEYEEGTIPGVGRWMVNLHWQNLIIQATDMDIPYRGVDLAFRRTYNSLSDHDYEDTDGASEIGQYGQGWTNTFDAHMSTNNCASSAYTFNGYGGFSVYDVDGARYDYCYDASGNLTPPPGMEGTSLIPTADGGYFNWTKKSGTQYGFYAPYYSTQWAAYSGRMYQLRGRNRNNYLQFSYSWDNGDASTSARLNFIYVMTESGAMQAALGFSEFSGRRLCSSLMYPNGQQATYSYDAAGTLWGANLPGNNAVGVKWTAYRNYRTPAGMTVSGPRWNAAWNGSSSTDGGYVAFTMGGYKNAQVAGISNYGVMNFTPSDTTSTPYSGVDGLSNPYQHTSIAGYPDHTSITDSDGHQKIFYIDGLGRPVARQEYTGSTWLTTNQSWDAHNNLVAETDARNNETDYVYDGNGNTVAVGNPLVTLAQGTFRPTLLHSYDAFNNVTSTCDARWSHANGRDWNATGAPASSDTLCPGTAGSSSSPGPIVYQYQYPAQEPFGELTSATSQLGYVRTFGYATSSTDYGLLLTVTGRGFTQTDGTQFSESKTFTYDAKGNVTGYGTGQGTWSLSYNTLNRLVSATDPDNVTSQTCYFPDGSVKAKQSALQYGLDGARCGSHSVAYGYDADGNAVSETHNFGNVVGTTTKWYDPADRLVEVVQPHDTSDLVSYSWMTRYIYDLSQGGSAGQAPQINGTAVSGYGNLVKTQEYMPPTVTGQPTNLSLSPQWVDLRGNAFDALDRPTAAYEAAFGTTPKQTNQYDASGQLGFMSSTANAAGQFNAMAYDALGRKLSDTYSGDSGLTPNRSVVYDVTDQNASITTSDLGIQSYTYDAEGHELSMTEPTSGAVDSPATVTYSYYPNGTRSQLTITASAFSRPVGFTYAYRNDGKLQTESFSNQYSGGPYSLGITYSPAGRIRQRTDPLTGKTVPAVGGNNGDGTTWSMPATTFVPQTYGYDGNGNLNAMTIPRGGAYSSFTRDPEGEVTSFAAYAIPGSDYSGVTESIAHTDRGEETADSVTCPSTQTCSTSGAPKQYFNGFPGSLGNQGDLRSGQNYGNTNESYAGTDFKYDQAGRLTGSVNRYMVGLFNPVLASPSYTRTYDAENRIRTQTVSPSVGSPYTTAFTQCTAGLARTPAAYYPTTMGFSYWPEGNAANVSDSGDGGDASGPDASYTWHWDGSDLLFTSQHYVPTTGPDSRSGTVFAGKDAAYSTWSTTSATVISVYDRDWTGTVVSSHGLNGDGSYSYGAWQGQGPAAKVTCKNGHIANLYPVSSTGDGSIGDGLMPRSDGYVADVITLQGVRSYDPNAGQWTTPDAYAGDVHDPMSQKLFMWNRNNPFEYEDFDGFNPVPTLPDIGRTHSGPFFSGNAPDMFSSSENAEHMASAIALSRLDFNSDPIQIAARSPKPKKTTKKSGKEASTKRPSWLADASPPRPGEIAQDYAKRILDAKYGDGKWRKGGNSEYSAIVKYMTRSGKI